MRTTLRKLAAVGAALTALSLTAAPAQAAVTISDPGYDTTTGGTGAQKAAIDLRSVTYWRTEYRFYIKFTVRDLTSVSRKEFRWKAYASDVADYITVDVRDGDVPDVWVGTPGTSGFRYQCQNYGERTASTSSDYVMVWLPKKCFHPGVLAKSPIAQAYVRNSAGTTIVSDRTAAGTSITPNP